jgi:carboxymethylenebutenolidase
MTHTTIELHTEDGVCAAHVLHPDGDGPWPGVLFYMDGVGMRPVLVTMAERLASAGYYVLLPNLFYRDPEFVAPDPKKLFADPEVRAAHFKRLASVTSAEHVMRDTVAFLAHFAAQANVVQPKIGVTGYCMGGRLALTAAGRFPERVAAAAAYHPGNVATDAPDSMHLLAPRIRARVYVGGAMEDPSFSDEQKQRLEQALTAAGVDHVIETYPARHGWTVADMPIYDEAQAERHWTTLLQLFESTLA